MLFYDFPFAVCLSRCQLQGISLGKAMAVRKTTAWCGFHLRCGQMLVVSADHNPAMCRSRIEIGNTPAWRMKYSIWIFFLFSGSGFTLAAPANSHLRF
jgi:hypothetical protein